MPLRPCQRWRERRDSYRPAGEPIDPGRYGVELLEERPAKAFVCAHHYSGSYPAARLRVGLYRAAGAARRAELVGVAVFSVPAQPRVIPRYLPGSAAGVELGRFVLLDDVPANGETWFLARAFRALHAALPEVAGVVSYSDPVRRAAADGLVVTPGHVGTIYQAFNGTYLGRSRGETLVLDPRGRALSRRALSKIRLEERGAGYAYEQLLAAGAPARRPLEDGAEYVERALAEGPFRRLKHPGNHVYAWAFTADVRRGLDGETYPKRSTEAA